MTARFRRSAVAIGALLLASAACMHVPFRGALDRAEPPPAAGRPELAAFVFDRNAPYTFELDRTGETPDYTVYLVKFRTREFPELHSTGAQAYYFVQKKPGAPVLLCLPQTGGPLWLVRGFAEYYAQHGFTTMAFYRREGFFNPAQSIEYNVDLIRQAVIDVRRSIDFLESRLDPDTNRIAIMGVSLGGIIAALAAEADGRIKAAAMLVAAGDLPTILEKSHYSRVIKFRNAMIKRYGLKDCRELARYAGSHMQAVDPIAYADRVDPARVLLINGWPDGIINIAAADATWRAFGRPERRVLPVGHYSSFALVDQAKSWTLAHFRRVLGLPS